MPANSKPAKKKRQDGTDWIFKRTDKAMGLSSSSQSKHKQQASAQLLNLSSPHFCLARKAHQRHSRCLWEPGEGNKEA
jgi:hypothetical protein